MVSLEISSFEALELVVTLKLWDSFSILFPMELVMAIYKTYLFGALKV